MEEIKVFSTQDVEAIASKAIDAVLEGEINPIEAHISVAKMEQFTKMYRADDRIRDVTLAELAKYGKKQSFGDITLEEAEVGVKYDFTVCTDSKLDALYAERKELEELIKLREAMLKAIPEGQTIADTETGEILHRPARTSKTQIKTSFRNGKRK